MSKEEFKFDKVNQDNWNKPDERTLTVFEITKMEDEVGATQEEMIEEILKPKLDKSVPIEVREVFEVARTVLVYGYYFYPFYTLGEEQLTRVLECAAYKKCEEINAPPGAMGNFHRHICHLSKQGIIEEDDKERWKACKDLRNEYSHLKRQNLIMPLQAIGTIKTATELINSLYQK